MEHELSGNYPGLQKAEAKSTTPFQIFELATGQPPFDSIMIDKQVLIRQIIQSVAIYPRNGSTNDPQCQKKVVTRLLIYPRT